MDPNPPRPAFQLALLLLISLEILALVIENYVLLFGVLIAIVIVAFYWFRYVKAHSLKAKYSPENATPKEDWRGKSDKDNNPL
jgi:predicted lysophospholipase L1 biosynthesis ABC-type transport system permease subunit